MMFCLRGYDVSQQSDQNVCLPHKAVQINYQANKTFASHLAFPAHSVSSHNDLDFSLGHEGVNASAFSQGE